MNESLKNSESYKLASLAKKASYALALTDNNTRNAALESMCVSFKDNFTEIMEANAKDLENAKEANISSALIDRLTLTEKRLKDIIDAWHILQKQDDPLNKILDDRTLYNGIQLQKVSVPLGVIGVIYEARPNVTADIVGLCIKSGNACVLKGGRQALHSNIAITNAIKLGLEKAGLNKDLVQIIHSCEREETYNLMQLTELIDVIIPRGGASLINSCIENSKVPIIETGLGNCHTYINEFADPQKALNIVLNAKTQRPGVCNACETLLFDKAFLLKFEEDFIRILQALQSKNVVLHLCDDCAQVANKFSVDYVEATDEDWSKEYLDFELSVKSVKDYKEAINHINFYSTAHSDCIVTENKDIAKVFTQQINSSCVYVNASTRFSDGGQFGLGAEVGISTQKLHVRGPFGVDGLTSTKYILFGDGQIRE